MQILILDTDQGTHIGQAIVDVLSELGQEPILTCCYTDAKKILDAEKPRMVILNKTPTRTDEVERIAKEAKTRHIKTVLISTNRPGNTQYDEFIRAPFDLVTLENVVFH